MNLMNITEQELLANLIREPIAPEKQCCEADRYYKSVIGTRTFYGKNEIKEVPNDIYWAYAWRYGADDCRTASICERSGANCIVIDDIDTLYFLDLNKEE